MVARKNIIGMLAVVIGFTALLTLLWRIVFKKSTHSISYIWLILVGVSSILWMCYGLMNQLIFTTVGASLQLIIIIVLFILKRYYEYTKQSLHLKQDCGY